MTQQYWLILALYKFLIDWLIDWLFDWLIDFYNCSISVNIRSHVYRFGMEEIGDQEAWDILWENYMNSDVASEKTKLRYALARTRQVWLLSRYIPRFGVWIPVSFYLYSVSYFLFVQRHESHAWQECFIRGHYYYYYYYYYYFHYVPAYVFTCVMFSALEHDNIMIKALQRFCYYYYFCYLQYLFLWFFPRYLEYCRDPSKIRGQDFFSTLGYIADYPVGNLLVWDWVRANYDYLLDR